MTTVPVHGRWSGLIDMKCSAKEDSNIWELVNMRGRHEVPLSQLVDELRATVEEREQVLAAMGMGLDGPYRFENALWEKPGNPFDFT